MNRTPSPEWYAKRALGRFKGRIDVDQKRSVDFNRQQHIFSSSWTFDDKYHNDPGIGAYYVAKDDKIAGLNFACPGCGQVTCVDFNTWNWDGNEAAPTLTPSILHNKEKGGCGWHGFLTAGQFRGA
jgi:hypothetical protein